MFEKLKKHKGSFESMVAAHPRIMTAAFALGASFAFSLLVGSFDGGQQHQALAMSSEDIDRCLASGKCAYA